MNFFKVIFLKLYLLYEKLFPLNRGKFFLSRILTLITGEINVRTHNGVWLRIIPSSSMDRSYLNPANQSHSNILKEIDKLNEGDVFIDIGSNIGYFSFKAASIVGNNGLVYSIEPSAREYRRLLYGLELNDLKNVLPFHCGLSDHMGLVNFQVNQYHTGLNRIEEDNSKTATKLMVPVFRGEDLIFNKKIALVKIDVEGAEYKVLAGLNKMLEDKVINKVIVEITPEFLNLFNTSKDELYNYMKAHNYKPLVNSDEWQFDEVFVIDELN